MRRMRIAALKRGVAVVAVVGVVVAISATWSANGSAATQATSTQLRGEGSWGAYREILTWQNELADAKSPIDLSYAAHGSLLGRQDFVAGSIDYVLSGVPFTADELTKIKGGAAGVIAAPVQVSSLTALLQRPVPDGLTTIKLICDPDDPAVTDPDACVTRKKYDGAVRVPNVNLAAMLMRYAGGSAPPLSSWNNPSVLRAMGVQNFTTPPLAGPAPVLRSDQDEFNYYMQQYVAQGAPSVWAGLKAQDTRIPWDPITERLGRQASASRDGVEQQGQQLGLGGGDPGSGTISGFTAGVLAAVPASTKANVEETFPAAKVEFIEVQNANGDWVAPTAESISLGIQAGDAKPLYALTNKVPGAYPLSWVDYLYAPASGLTREKAEALATVIRYLATAGQSAAKPVGEGKLSAALTQQALAAADQLIESNCAGKVVANTDLGPYAPDVPAMKTIGTVKHCTTEPKDVSAPPSGENGGSTTYDSSTFDTTSAATTDSAATADVSASADGNKHGAVTVHASASLAASKLPLPFPAGSSGVDRFATLVLGAGLYLLLRKPVRKWLARGRAA